MGREGTAPPQNFYCPIEEIIHYVMTSCLYSFYPHVLCPYLLNIQVAISMHSAFLTFRDAIVIINQSSSFRQLCFAPIATVSRYQCDIYF